MGKNKGASRLAGRMLQACRVRRLDPVEIDLARTIWKGELALPPGARGRMCGEECKRGGVEENKDFQA